MLNAKLLSVKNSLGGDQKNLLRIFIISSTLVHVIALFLGHRLSFLSAPAIPEWSIETELVTNIDLGAASKTTLPNAKISDQVTVPSNLLPQITKNFKVKQPSEAAEGMINDPKAPAPKGSTETKEVAEAPAITQNEEASTKLKQSEALRRLALDALRRDQKVKAKELQAHEQGKLPKIKQALHKDAGISGSVEGGLLSIAESKRYSNYLNRAIRRNWALPKTFQITNSNMQATVSIIINARGELVTVSLAASSGESTFDRYCIDAVKNSAPYKSPPKSAAGDKITINCIP